ncbi:hypothetical protein ACFVUS_26280 [Nocardia sp. NPDC058058]|uniref:hypothetical protein n=1 Tax=Nocardia sp. NPDC058058 TaxID=3346317 RepID=UPI0036DBE89B
MPAAIMSPVSMWLTLVKVDPIVLARALERPDLLQSLVEDADSGEHIDGFRPDTDRHAEDLGSLIHIAEGRAEAEEGIADWVLAYRNLARATGFDPDSALDSDDHAFALDPAAVRAVTEGLTAEGWTRFLGLGPFLVAAAREGKAVLGAVS